MTDVAFDYPSQRSGRLYPRDPVLLDTCVVQNLKVVMEAADDEYMTNDAVDCLLRRYPPPLGDELVALGDLVAMHRNEPPWIVAESSLLEFDVHEGRRADALRQWWLMWADYSNGCLDSGWYPGLDVEHLMIRRAPAVADGQESLPIEPPCWPLSAECVPPLGPFPDAGDRVLIRTALRAGIPMILTTDLKSLWRHRRALYPLGIEIWRPTDLRATMFRAAA